MKFDENLRNLRKEKEFSQEYLAEKMNVSRQTISKWENGSAMPDLKKLTELAELFDTSMDELLGTSAPANASYQADFAELNSVKAELSSVKEVLKEYKSKSKRMNIILCLCVIALAVTSIVTNNNLRTTTDDLWGAVNSISHSNSINISNNDSEPTITDYVEYSMTNIDSENPNIVEMTFKYSPISYVKGSRVSYIISDNDNNSKPITAQSRLDGKAFVAKAEIDIAKYNSVDISVDDGTNVKTEELYMYLSREYSGITGAPIIYYTQKNNDITRVHFYGEINEVDVIEWENNSALPKKTEAYVEARLNNGKVVYSKELEIKTYEEASRVIPTDFSVNQSFDKIVIRIVDENKTQYIIGCDNEETSEDEATVGENSIMIEFPNGEKLYTDNKE